MSRLLAAAKERNDADQRIAIHAMLALAVKARQEWPEAAYILLAETDQDDSGELWVQAVYDAENGTIGDEVNTDSGEPIAYYLHHGNSATWLPFMTVMNEPGKRNVGEYLLDINQVFTLQSPPKVHRVLDASLSHLPHEVRDLGLNEYEGIIADERECGWLLYVPADIGILTAEDADELPEYRTPEAIVALWQYAQDNDCQYVLLDTEGHLLDLPIYD